MTGGARSGKSRFAQELALKLGEPVLYMATAAAGDEEMHQRIAEHQKERPATWRTLEVSTHIGSQIVQGLSGARVVIVDCITLLVNNIFNQFSERIGDSAIESEVIAEIDELMTCVDRLDASFIIVTNEVGLGLVPANKVGRLYRDLLGRANQRLAQRADEVYLMVSGLPLRMKPAIGR